MEKFVHTMKWVVRALVLGFFVYVAIKLQNTQSGFFYDHMKEIPLRVVLDYVYLVGISIIAGFLLLWTEIVSKRVS
ncbi:hypothetical protein LCL95_00950 [Bacillus timonensis]|nr:hypothetical protein [Bacillus timonensis]